LFLTIESITPDQIHTLWQEESDLLFTLTGAVQGLQNGKVSLNSKGDILKKCQALRSGDKGLPQVTQVIVSLSRNGPELMRFEMKEDGREKGSL
jgi:hypothetical protein